MKKLTIKILAASLITLAFLACSTKSPTAVAGGFSNEVVLKNSDRCALPIIGGKRYYWPGYNVSQWDAYVYYYGDSLSVTKASGEFVFNKGFYTEGCDSVWSDALNKNLRQWPDDSTATYILYY